MKISSILAKFNWLILVIFIIASCNSNHTNKNNNQANININKEKKVLFPNLNFSSPENKREFKPSETPRINLSTKDTLLFDSIQIYYNNAYIKTELKLPVELSLKNEKKNPGKLLLKAKIFRGNNSEEQVETYRFLSDVEPKMYSYQIIKVYPHERSAYTQGLVFDDGYFYESNGIKGESTLRKVQIGTGDPIQTFTLAPEIFAEGLTIMGDKIYQLSWQNQTGFVYDKKSFQLLNQFSYTTEGWGLTNDGKYLILSDGTEILYFIDPRSFAEVTRIEVYDNKGPVVSLNELEMINGEIWANIYRTDKIARIDPKTGKVLAYIDLSKLLNTSDYEQGTDVLNGIAYDSTNKRLFVTGKKWPKLFEIKLK